MLALTLRLPAVLLLLAMSAVQAKPDPLKAQRELFLDARAALQDNRLEEYQSLVWQLRDYPLYPYLQFDELRNRLSSADEQEVARFLEVHEGEPVGDRLRQSWLYNLARNQRWRLFLRHYRPTDSVDLQCYALQARLATGDKKGLVEDILTLWLTGESRPKACDPPFKFLADSGRLDRNLVWARIRLAMEGNRPALAGYLAKRLPEPEKAWVTLWREANDTPSRTLEDPRLEADTPLAREITLHALRRIARYDAAQAHEKWLAIRDRQAFENEDAAAIEGYIAYAAATQRLPEAHAWLAALPATAETQRIREWRIRTAIDNQDWAAVRVHITALPVEERDSEEWRYWLAFAMEKTGERVAAVNRFGDLAKERSYHGFLAADYLRWPYQMGHQPTAYNAAELEALGRRPGLVRANELYRAGLLTDARREWAYAIRDMNNEELTLAAVLADRWAWHDRAILTVARSGSYDDLKLRFPLDYLDSVRRHARDNKLDTGLDIRGHPPGKRLQQRRPFTRRRHGTDAADAGYRQADGETRSHTLYRHRHPARCRQEHPARHQLPAPDDGALQRQPGARDRRLQRRSPARGALAARGRQRIGGDLDRRDSLYGDPPLRSACAHLRRDLRLAHAAYHQPPEETHAPGIQRRALRAVQLMNVLAALIN